MDIFSLGHSSFKIKGKQGILVTDPFDPELTGYKFPKTEANIVTISHNHKDHNFSDQILGNPFIISGPGEYEICDIFVKGVSAFHDDKNGSERGKNYIYKIEMDGINLIHLGDLGHKLTDDQKEQLGDSDILFIPVGGVFTINSELAGQIITQLEPKIVIPMHYSEDRLNKENFKELGSVDDFLKEMGKEKKVLPKLQISKDKLPSELEIIVLE